MSQWTHVVGTIYLYTFVDPKESTLNFMKKHISLIPKGSEGPIEYFYSSSNRVTASDGKEKIKGSGAITFIGDLRDMDERTFCEGLEEFLNIAMDELPVRDLTFIVSDEWSMTNKHYFLSGLELISQDVDKILVKQPSSRH